jgi:hypothetical protein
MTDHNSPKFKVGDHVQTTVEASEKDFRRALEEGHRIFGIVAAVNVDTPEDGGQTYYDLDPDGPYAHFFESELEPAYIDLDLVDPERP